ncbi:hypothetical protein Tco_0222400 [Tanacetum coccineum]
MLWFRPILSVILLGSASVLLCLPEYALRLPLFRSVCPNQHLPVCICSYRLPLFGRLPTSLVNLALRSYSDLIALPDFAIVFGLASD